ncbi:MAG: GNAT family N-acetyltransferase [Bacteroidota bacterium]
MDERITSYYSGDETLYRKSIPTFGEVGFRHLHLEQDVPIIHEWVTQPYAVYWGMNGFTLEETMKAHQELLARPDYDILIGTRSDKAIFMMECYKASEDIIGSYYDALPGDYGMHILISPPEQGHRIHHFTWNVFSCVMDFLFNNPKVERVIVEPDVRNEKIHVLNKRAGFQYQKIIQLPHKTAHLACCTRQDYTNALYHTDNLKETSER